MSDEKRERIAALILADYRQLPADYDVSPEAYGCDPEFDDAARLLADAVWEIVVEPALRAVAAERDALEKRHDGLSAAHAKVLATANEQFHRANRLERERDAALARAEKAEAEAARLREAHKSQEAEARFAAYFRRNYPGPDTIIHDPDWHAPRLYQAAIRAALAQEPGE